MNPSATRLNGRNAALLTKHDKLPLIQPFLAPLDISIQSTDAFDTDELGTFSGEIARTLSPVDCARKKAQLAIEATGLDIGIGSEGSFGGGPMAGLMNWDDEILVLYDAKNDFEIVSFAQGPIKVNEIAIQSFAELDKIRSDFDGKQGWILKSKSRLRKGLTEYRDILQAIESLELKSEMAFKHQQVKLEPDFRAMYCPERQDYIRKAALQLSERIGALCPECEAPDFWRVEAVKGARCTACGLASNVPKAFIKRCRICQFEVQEPSETEFIDPGQCELCNP